MNDHDDSTPGPILVDVEWRCAWLSRSLLAFLAVLIGLAALAGWLVVAGR